MMTVIRPPPPPPTTTSQSLAESVQTLMARVEVLEVEKSRMGEEVEKLRAQVKILEEERQWWRRWHRKWGPKFREWRDEPSAPSDEPMPPPPAQ